VKVLLLQLDGKMPNIALMRIAAHHRDRGDEVVLQQARRPDSVERGLWDDWDRVYASTIFTKTLPVVRRLKQVFPDAIVGGTGVDIGKPEGEWSSLDKIGIHAKRQDYGLYPSFRQSIGFTQRGCRLNCYFCVVPKKEGKVRAEQTIAELWRGDPWPRELILLDNDFFGQETWREVCEELRTGAFKVSFSQGINARMLNPLAAQKIAQLDYRDDTMKNRCIHTAWDSIGDEAPLFRGLNALKAAGVNPRHITVYMLIGSKDDDEEGRLHRVNRLKEFGCRPFPMPYHRTEELVGFQRWVVGLGAWYKRIRWDDWKANGYRPEGLAIV
jgi:hypothetical protein